MGTDPNRMEIVMTENPYMPLRAKILSVTQETGLALHTANRDSNTASDLDIKTYRLQFADGHRMSFLPGQFVELSIPGVGEAPFGFASNPFDNETFELTIKRTGVLTEAIHALKANDYLWARGPFGNTFPVDQLMGRDILFIAGGLGLAPLRPLISYVFDPSKRKNFGDINLLIAARSSADFIYRSDYKKWQQNADLTLTIDREEPGWAGKVGFPHNLVGEIAFDKAKTTAVLCGPPVMIKATARQLLSLGIKSENIITTLEMRMTCGIGKCGKCNIGHQYVCVDGPVFSLAQLEAMPDEY